MVSFDRVVAEDLSREGTNTSYKQTGAIMQIFTLITPCDKRDWRFIPEFPRVCLCSDVSNLPITGRFSHRFLDLSSLFKIIMTD
jgi:hypothetical protein